MLSPNEKTHIYNKVDTFKEIQSVIDEVGGTDFVLE